MARKTQSPIWELGLAVREKDETTGKNIAVCKVKIDAANPDLTCNKKIGLPSGSTSLLRHHMKSKHPTKWVNLLSQEKKRAVTASEKQEEANKVLQEMEGDPDELEEDLTPSQV